MQWSRRSVIAGLASSGCVAAAPGGALVMFRAPDGVPVSSLSYGDGKRAVLLVPGGHGIGEAWHLQARRLAHAGFRVLAMDFRGLGGSPGVPQDSDKAHLDVLGAVRQLKADGAEQVAVVGASWGGWAAATAAISDPGLIDRLVLLAHSPFENPERLEGRKLFIVAAGDRDGSGRLRLDKIRDQFDRVPAPKNLVVLDGGAHAQFLFLTSQGRRLFTEIARFLSAP
jgi:pimeloyl-ACP methyl ester carboxylesterase